MEFDIREKVLMQAAIDRYIYDLRKACEEDQGTPDGKMGTVGYNQQRRLKELKEKINAG